MKKHILNTNIQLFLFPGIVLLGLIICFFTKDINLMPIFYGVSLFSRSFFSFLGNVYGNGHWYSKKRMYTRWNIVYITLYTWRNRNNSLY